jgi:hypothetical protein
MRNLLLVALGFLAGCNKNTDTTSFAGSYMSDTTINLFEIRMFTSAGEIFDTSLMRSFINRHKPEYGPSLDSSSEHIYSNYMKLIFLSLDSLIVYRKYYADSTGWHDSLFPHRAVVTSRSNSELTITELDSTRDNALITDNQSHTLQLYQQLLQIRPVKLCFPIGFGYEECHFRYTFPVKISTLGGLILPLLNSKIVSFASNELNAKYAWNTFNGDGLTYLLSGDTIIYQRKELPLLRY